MQCKEAERPCTPVPSRRGALLSRTSSGGVRRTRKTMRPSPSLSRFCELAINPAGVEKLTELVLASAITHRYKQTRVCDAADNRHSRRLAASWPTKSQTPERYCRLLHNGTNGKTILNCANYRFSDSDYSRSVSPNAPALTFGEYRGVWLIR